MDDSFEYSRGSKSKGRKGGKGRREEEEDSFDDASSVASSSAYSKRAGSSEEDEVPPSPAESIAMKLSAAIEQLGEKRGTIREAGLNDLCTLFSKYNLADEASNNVVTITDNILRYAVKKGSDIECSLGMRAATLLLITLGDAPQSISAIESLLPVARDAALAASTSTSSFSDSVGSSSSSADSSPFFSSRKSAFITAWSVAEFVQCSAFGAPLPLSSMDALVRMRPEKMSGNVCASAVFAWTLLACLCPPNMRATTLFDKYARFMLRCLNHTDLNARIEAGTALALMYEARAQLGIARDEEASVADEDEQDEQAAPEEERQESSVDGDHGKTRKQKKKSQSTVYAAVAEKIAELSEEFGHQKSKKDLSQQKQIFRSIQSTVEGEGLDGESIRIGSVTLEFDTWSQLKFLQFFRATLKNGLTTHIQSNAFVQHWLQIPSGADFGADAVKLDKKLLKGAQQELTKQRAKQRQNTGRQTRYEDDD